MQVTCQEFIEIIQMTVFISLGNVRIFVRLNCDRLSLTRRRAEHFQNVDFLINAAWAYDVIAAAIEKIKLTFRPCQQLDAKCECFTTFILEINIPVYTLRNRVFLFPSSKMSCLDRCPDRTDVLLGQMLCQDKCREDKSRGRTNVMLGQMS